MDSPNGMESNDFAASHMDVVHEASSTAKMEKTGDPSAEAVATSSETCGGDGGELGMSDEELARLLAKQFEEEESRALEEDESFARQLQAIEEHERERQRAEQRRQHQMMQQQQQQQQQRHQQQQRLEQQLQQYLEQAQRQLASALTTSGAASPSPLSSSSSASSSPAAFSLSSSASSSSSPSPWAHMLSAPSTTTPSSSLSSSAPTPYLFPGGGGPVSMPPMMSMPMMPTPFGSVPPPPAPPPSSTLQAGGSWSLYQQVRAAKKAREEGDSAAGAPTSSLSSSSSSLSSAPTDSSPAQLTFTCPICLEGGIKEEELYTHTTERHSDVGQVRHVCPVCASRPNGNPNYKSRDYAGHVGLRHKPAHLRGPDEGEEDESARAPPPQLRQSRARTHLITRTARGFRMISNRSLETLMDYLIHVDTDVVQLPGCQLCHRRLKPTHTRAILECGHHYHAQCLPSDTPSPTCPLCDRKQQAAARRILSSSSSSQREEGASDDAGGGDSAVMAAPIEEAETSAMTCEE